MPGEAPFKKILVPTDLSAFSEPAVCLAVSLAASSGAEIVFVHVWPRDFDYEEAQRATHDPALRHHREEEQDHHRADLDKFVARFTDGSVKKSCVLRSGPPYLAIAMAAQEFGADLIIMGTHGRSGLSHVLIGSVAEKVVRSAHCPVMTVKPENFKFQEICL